MNINESGKVVPLVRSALEVGHSQLAIGHCLCVLVAMWAFVASGEDGEQLKPISLPPPQTSSGKPLMQALKERRTTREFKTNDLPAQVLSNLLWAGFGINRPDNDHRTAPSAMNSQEIDLYVARADGLFLYQAKAHELRPVGREDLRAKTTGQDSIREAPVTLIFVADFTRLTKAKPEDRLFYAGIDTGCIVQNIYLCSASQGLASVVHDLDRGSLAAAMKLRPDQRIILCQAVGYPK